MSASTQPFLTLNNGLKFPQVGLGTWKGIGTECEDMVYNAIKVGYRHIDTARIYNNEDQVGAGVARAIKDGLVTRDELFIVTKLWNDDQHDVEGALKASLSRLNLDYVDLYLVHWPVAWKKGTTLVDESIGNLETWKSMERMVEMKLAKSIGVSNFNEAELQDIFDNCTIKPVVNQVEIHPYFNNFKLQRFCHDNQVYLTAYSALMPESTSYKFIPWVDMAADPLVVALAEKYEKSPQQILLRWQLEVGNSVITKSSKVERMHQNFDIINFKIDPEDVKKLSSFPPKRYRNPHDFRMPVEQWFFKDE